MKLNFQQYKEVPPYQLEKVKAAEKMRRKVGRFKAVPQGVARTLVRKQLSLMIKKLQLKLRADGGLSFKQIISDTKKCKKCVVTELTRLREVE